VDTTKSGKSMILERGSAWRGLRGSICLSVLWTLAIVAGLELAALALPVDPSCLVWERLGGPPGGLGYDIRFNSDHLNNLFVTDANAGLHRSDDGGATWSLVSVDPTALGTDRFKCFCVTFDPNDPTYVWSGAKDSGGLYFSQDGGITWERRVNGFREANGFTLRGITVQPGDSSVVYVAGEISSWIWAGEERIGGFHEFDMTQGVVYKSTDQGRSWHEIWRGDNLARFVLIDPRDTDVLFVSTGIFDREASNSNWASREPGGVGVLKSVDGGQTWTVLNETNGLMGLYVGSLAMSPEDPETLLAGVGHDHWTRACFGSIAPAGAFLSVDGGETWDRTLNCDFISAVEFAPSDPSIAYAAGDQEFHRSDDGGRTWQRVGESAGGNFWGPPGTLAGVPIDIEIDPRDPYCLFVNNYAGGNYFSKDGGETWADASSGYSGAPVHGGFAIDTQNPDRVYCGVFGGLFRSDDGGTTWQGLGYEPARYGYPVAVAASPWDWSVVLQSPWDMGVLARSADGGLTWTRSNPLGSGLRVLGGGVQYLDIAFAPSDPEIVYAAAGDRGCESRLYIQQGQCITSLGGVYRSEDGGVTWERASGITMRKSVAALAVHPKEPMTVLAGVLGGGLYATSDGGETWVERSIDLISVRDIAICPAAPAVVYAAGYGSHGGVFRSEDGGISWDWASAGLDPELPTLAIEVDPVDPMTVWAAGGTRRGVAVSLDGGRSWHEIDGGLVDEHMTTLSLSHDGTVLYGGTELSGAYRLDIYADTPCQGASSPDRDGDGVPDDEDYCPDYPGNPGMNGC